MGEIDRHRRGMLKSVGALGAMSGFLAFFGATPARAKSSRAAVSYRDSPNGRQSCANCGWYAPPSGCGVVKGPVSARGWCALWG